jgi:hypothetical protein
MALSGAKLIYVSLPSDDDSIYSSLDDVSKSTAQLTSTTMHIPPPIATPDPVPVGTTQSATSIYTTPLPAQLMANSTPAPLTVANVGISETSVPTATTGSQPLGQIQNAPTESTRPLKKVKTAAAAVVGTGLTSKYGSACGARQH